MTPDPLISKMYSAMKQNISELAKLQVKNEDPWDGNTGYEEAEKLDAALSGGNQKQIIEATLGLLYVVRCNLFHADKNLNDTRDGQIMYYASIITSNISWTLVQELP